MKKQVEIIITPSIEKYNDLGQLHHETEPAFITEHVKKWYLNGKLHRENAPAIEYSNGDWEWYSHGVHHRDGQPAYQRNNSIRWYKYGHLHHENAPAMISAEGDQYWYLNGKLHRENAPAIEYANGIKEWWFRSKRHRTNGPAITNPKAPDQWWINGQRYYFNRFQLLSKKFIRIKNSWLNIPNIENYDFINSYIDNYYLELEKKKNTIIEDIKIYNKDGQLHCDNGPAIIFANGNKHWYKNGLLHREDGPAMEELYKHCWYINGKLHRKNNPAIIFCSGVEHWYLDGQLHRNFGPAIVQQGDYYEWFSHGAAREPSKLEKNYHFFTYIKDKIYSGYTNCRLYYDINKKKTLFIVQPEVNYSY
jgi:hypothetical protein